MDEVGLQAIFIIYSSLQMIIDVANQKCVAETVG